MKESHQPPLILHVVYSLGTGGLENGMINIINRIPPDRYRHAVVCITASSEFANRLTADVDVIELHKREGHDLGFYWRLWKVLWRLRPAIVHTRNIAAIEAQLLAWFVPGTHGVHGEHGRDIYDIAGENRKYRLLRKLLNPFIDRFIAVSQDLAVWLQTSVGIPEIKIEQIYNGVDTERFSPRAESNERVFPEDFSNPDSLVIGTVGRLAEIKDQASLLRAVRAFLEANPGLAPRVRLIIVGDGPLRGQLERMISELQLDGFCWMAGDRQDIPELLSKMDVFVLPSLGEGISNTILEAMACGLPILASRVGGNPELVEHESNGLLFSAGDVDALARALENLLTDPDRRARMARKSRDMVVENFSWSKTVSRYCAVYDDMAPEGASLGVI